MHGYEHSLLQLNVERKGIVMGTLAIESLSGKIDNQKAKLVYAIYTDSIAYDDGEFSLNIEMDEKDHLIASILYRDFDEKWIERFWDHFQSSRGFRDKAIEFFKSVDIEKCFKEGTPSIPPLPAARSPIEIANMSKAVKSIIKKNSRAKFRDYAELKSGRDKFSAMKTDALLEHLAINDTPNKIKSLDISNQQKVLRWMARGLPEDMAIRKVKTDLEISENANSSKKQRNRKGLY